MTRSRDPISAALQAIPTPAADEPGFAVALWRNDHPPAYLCQGVAQRGGAPISPQTMFDLASISKMFTALAIHLTAQRHGFTEDTLLADLLPEMAAAAPQVTVGHLLHHLSGLPDYMGLFEGQGLGTEDRLGMTETLKILSQQPTSDPPEQRFSYSNTGYVLLSAILERVTGSTTARLMREQIFDPLGMRATALIDHMPPALPDLAQSYESADGAEINPLWDMTGDGQIYSNLEEMGLWVAELLSPHIFANVLPAMLRPPVSPTLGPLDYASGLHHLRFQGETAFGHDGGWAGFSSSLLILPQRQMACLALVNRRDIDAGDLREAVMTQAIDPTTPAG